MSLYKTKCNVMRCNVMIMLHIPNNQPKKLAYKSPHTILRPISAWTMMTHCTDKCGMAEPGYVLLCLVITACGNNRVPVCSTLSSVIAMDKIFTKYHQCLRYCHQNDYIVYFTVLHFYFQPLSIVCAFVALFEDVICS